MINFRLPSTNDTAENERIAGELMSIPFLTSALLFPIIGYTIDKYGKRTLFLILSALLVIAGHVTMLYIYPILPLILLGLGYSLFGGIVWPSVALVVNPKNLGIAYGL